MQHLIGEHEIDDTFFIDRRSKIFVICTCESCIHSVMTVHHTGYSVKSEAIEFVLIHPEAKIGEQKTKDFVISVVKKTTDISRNEEIYLSQSSWRPFGP